MKQEFTIINNQRIAYIQDIQDNTKPITVFFHGWMSSKESFHLLYSHRENYIAFDFPNMGSSAPLSKPWEIKDFAEFTSQFLEKIITNLDKNSNEDQLEPRKYNLLVHSFGGRILLEMLNLNLPMPAWENITMTGVPFYPPEDIKTKGFKMMNTILETPIFSWMKPLASKIYRSLFSAEDYATLGENKILQKTFQNTVNYNISGFIHLLRRYKNVNLIWGDNDTEAPLSSAKKAHVQLPSSKLHIIPNAGHFPWSDDTKLFLKYLK